MERDQEIRAAAAQAAAISNTGRGLDAKNLVKQASIIEDFIEYGTL